MHARASLITSRSHRDQIGSWVRLHLYDLTAFGLALRPIPAKPTDQPADGSVLRLFGAHFEQRTHHFRLLSHHRQLDSWRAN